MVSNPISRASISNGVNGARSCSDPQAHDRQRVASTIGARRLRCHVSGMPRRQACALLVRTRNPYHIVATARPSARPTVDLRPPVRNVPAMTDNAARKPGGRRPEPWCQRLALGRRAAGLAREPGPGLGPGRPARSARGRRPGQRGDPRRRPHRRHARHRARRQRRGDRRQRTDPDHRLPDPRGERGQRRGVRQRPGRRGHRRLRPRERLRPAPGPARRSTPRRSCSAIRPRCGRASRCWW